MRKRMFKTNLFADTFFIRNRKGDCEMKRKDLLLLISGGVIYPTLEMAWRGYTHVSMAVAGGVCVVLIDRVCNGALQRSGLTVRCFAGGTIITSVELVAGIVVNFILKLHVWDYSHLPLNIFGQICLPFTALWMLASIPAMALGHFFGKSKELNRPLFRRHTGQALPIRQA